MTSSSSDCDDWEEVELNQEDNVDNNSKDIDFGSNDISFTLKPAAKRKGITKEQRLARVNLHKAQTICYIAHAISINRMLDNEEIKCIILSHLSPAIINEFWGPSEKASKSEVVELMTAKLTRLVDFWTEKFTITSDNECDFGFESLKEAALYLRGSVDTFCLLFLACCRALSLGTRIVINVKAVSLSLSVQKKLLEKENQVKRPSKKRKLSKESRTPLSIYWAEILIPSMKQWIFVNSLDRESINCYSFFKAETSYIFALEPGSDRVKEITWKYVTELPKKARIDLWIQDTLQKHFQNAEAFDKMADQNEDEEIKRRLGEQEIPKTISGFLNHPRYVLERHLKKFELIYPINSENIVGQIRGENIYPRECVRMLHTAEKWLSLEGRIVMKGEKPVKMVKSRVSPSSKNSIVRLGDVEAEDEQVRGMVGLFGEWQTEVYVPAPIVNGVIPKNKYNNIDLFKPSMLPPLAVHITEDSLLSRAQLQLNDINLTRKVSLKKIARKLAIDFAEAVTGFEYHGGRSCPVITGIVVAQENEELVRREYMSQLFDQIDAYHKAKEAAVVKRWEHLTKKALVYLRLKKDFMQG